MGKSNFDGTPYDRRRCPHCGKICTKEITPFKDETYGDGTREIEAFIVCGCCKKAIDTTTIIIPPDKGNRR